VDRARRHGILLNAVQVLTDLNLSIKKAYILSDGQWFMDVLKQQPFHKECQKGNEKSYKRNKLKESIVDGTSIAHKAKAELTISSTSGGILLDCVSFSEAKHNTTYNSGFPVT
ncbi:hypothetical protein Gotur_016442, partial [Gossypium turneri]